MPFLTKRELESVPAIPFVSPHADGEWDEHATIVGLWHVNLTANYDENFPPGGPYPTTPFPFLESFKTWHADGTEFENAFVPPAGGNICYGVWKDLGKGTVKLHHIGLMFNSDGSLSAIFTMSKRRGLIRSSREPLKDSDDFGRKLMIDFGRVRPKPHSPVLAVTFWQPGNDV